MSGKLPIDRVREAEDAPAIYDEHRERYAQHRAALEADTGDPADTDDPAGPADPEAPTGKDDDPRNAES